MALQFDTDVQFVKGVGPKLGDVFRRRGIARVQDLLEFYPRAYEDRRAIRQIRSLVPDQLVSIKAQIQKIRSFNLGKSRRKVYDVVIGDASGRISCKYFRVPYKGYFERFQPFQEVRVIGKVTQYRGVLEFHHPDIHPITEDEENTNELISIYTEIEGQSSAKIARLIRSVLSSEHPIPDPMPFWIVKENGLLPLDRALQEIHVPKLEEADAFLNFQAPSQRRLIFDEFFMIELHMALKRAGVEKEKSTPIQAQGLWPQRLEASLEFELTGAQKRSFAEIISDLRKPHPMHRLVQGDVGSGKTLVALLAAAFAAEGEMQTALMVPTEILAEQHYANASRRLAPLGMRVALLTSQVKGKERAVILQALKAGEIDVCIGTHALIQDDVEFAKLGLVIVDEQHRFGVEQRNKLKAKGLSPHFLVMTATPIPRTLAMTVYGDLDVSVIDELPKGRQPIVTRKTFASKRDLVMGFVRDQIKKGRQAYIVYPLVDESETMDLKNALEEYTKVKAEFSDFSVGLLHGRMKSSEKDEIMQGFRRNEIQILVATTVIEVGVDVPNANIMVIEHAERFGLSQLHQLRGRVGRGEYKSYCVLVLGYALSEEATKRAEIMESTNDGFKIAEADLEMRGPGEFLGTKQSGLPGFKLGNLVRDIKILQEARAAAFALAARDPDLKRPEHQMVRAKLESFHKMWVG
ncbi:MAG: ATP-dependent DNA helicase RecG [Bdellovibrionales bacterium]|nr:ATP-dependent DNA helicase RecG [Bdellovibrionales bacterium]